MSEERPQRERVTGPVRDAATRQPVEVTREIDQQTAVGEVFMRSLMWSQLRLALVVIGVLTGTVGALPLVFAYVPAARSASLLGIPLPWVLLGFVVYPALVALGWFYVRQAERNERDFSDLVDRP